MKYADKIGARFTLVLGDNELAEQKAVLKNMKTGETRPIRLGDFFLEDFITAITETQQQELACAGNCSCGESHL